MNFLFASLFSALSYLVSSRFVKRRFSLNCIKPTPAISRYDRFDFVPTKPLILFGSHLSAISGVGAVLGPSLSLSFGEFAVFWVLLLGILFGFFRDFLSSYISLGSNGEGIIELSEKHIGQLSRRLLSVLSALAFLFFIFIYLQVIPQFLSASGRAMGAFVFMLASSFVSSVLIRIIPVPQGIASLFAIIWIVISFTMSYYVHFPVDQRVLVLIILTYAFLSLVLPVWGAPQSYGFVSSFLFIPFLVLGGWGAISKENPSFNLFEFEKFSPLIFISLSCLGFSGLHGVLASSLSSRYASSECHILPTCWGGLIIELLVALIAIKSVLFGYSAGEREILSAFATGFAELSSNPYIPKEILRDFAILFLSSISVSSFGALTRSLYYILSSGREEGKQRRFAYKIVYFIIIAVFPFLLSLWLFRWSYSPAVVENLWFLFGAYNFSVFVGISAIFLGWGLRSKRNHYIYSLIAVTLLGIFLSASLIQLREFMLTKKFAMFMFLVIPLISAIFIFSAVIVNHIVSYYEEKVK